MSYVYPTTGGPSKRGASTLAFRIALRFPNRAPSARQIMEAFPEIPRGTAFRYARDYHIACQQRAA